ncbi:neurotensin receptor type 2-like [Physella acuta]|uniref:neurotensin receptor type 2-like n=1 Tax=Physella acuta TaxID=109671 RepID=UPI0027DC56E8|nr:neurotensin receptor type 2-like [Physella acuta]
MTNSSIQVSHRVVDVFNDEVKTLYMVVNFVALSSIVAVFGIVTNIINIVIFYRQGLASSTVNISFSGLAVSDLCGLLILALHNLCFNPLFENAGLPVVTGEVQHLTGGLLHLCCTRITGWITVYITAERCLCIATPLKIKRILTPRRATFIIVFIYFITIMPLAPEYLILY